MHLIIVCVLLKINRVICNRSWRTTALLKESRYFWELRFVHSFSLNWETGSILTYNLEKRNGRGQIEKAMRESQKKHGGDLRYFHLSYIIPVTLT
jgi:hypothetical protein